MRAYPFSTGVLSLAALVFGLSACMNAHQASPLPQQFARGGTSVKAPDAATAGMCSVYSGFGALSYCYDFDETSGTTLLDNSGAGHNGTISATGVTYGAAGLATNSLAAETTDGVTGTMISGFNPSSGSFSTSFYVSLHANLNNFPRLVATGNPAHTTPESGWNIAINNVTTNTVYANIGYGSGYLAFGYIPLALNTPANVTLTYDATSNAVTLCVGTASPPKCVSKTLPAAYAASGNAVVFGGGAKYTPANATFDEAGYWQGTVLTSSQIATLAGLAGVGATPAPTPIATSPPTPLPSSSSTLQGMCAIYGALGSPSYCYDFDDASGPTLLDNSGAGHNGTISASGVSYGATGLTTNSFAAETTDGATGAMTSGFNPSSGSFSTSFFVSLHANTNNLPRLVATGNPAHTTPENGWNVAINNVTTNTVYANIGYGTGYLAFGYIPLALNTSANVALTYDASVNAVTLCVGTASPPKCVTKTLPAAYVASGNPVVFGGGTKYAPASATFDEAAYWQGTVLTSAQIATLAGFAGTGPSPTPTPTPTASLLPASPTPATSATPAPTPSPAPSATVAFNDWPTYGFDAQRSGFNPNTTGITPASIAGGQLHLAWQVAVGASAATQPIVVTNIAGHQALIVVAGHASVYAYDALTGATVWGPSLLGTQPLNGCGTAGVAGTVQYDAALGALFVVAGNGATPSHPVLYKLNVNDGSIAGQVDVTPALLAGETVYAHTAVTFANGLLYFGTASSCESASWRGRVVAVDPVAMALVNTFYMTYGVGGNNFGGGGVWGWGGVSVDPTGNVYAASGNAETPNTLDGGTIAAPFVSTTDEQAGYAEHLVKLSSDLSTVEDSNYPGFNFQIGFADLDYTGVPVVFQPKGCDVLTGTQGKAGTLVVNDTNNLSTPTSYLLSEPAGLANYMGNPAYSPVTGLLYAAVASAQDGSLEPPGMVAFQFSCASSILWASQFGPDSFAYPSGARPRSAPTVTAGGVVFMGTPCTNNGSGGCGTPISGATNGALWAVDASTGAVLGGGNPVLITTNQIRMAPSADGLWLWVYDNSGNLYGMTVDPNVKAIAVRAGKRPPERVRYPR